MDKDVQSLRLRESARRQRHLQSQHVDEQLRLEERHREDFLACQRHWAKQAQHFEYTYSQQKAALNIRHQNELTTVAEVLTLNAPAASCPRQHGSALWRVLTQTPARARNVP